MAAKLLLVIILLIFLVTILNWLRLGQFLTVSPQFSPDEEKKELQQRREDQMFVESSKVSNGEGGGLGKKHRRRVLKKRPVTAKGMYWKARLARNPKNILTDAIYR